MAPPVEGILDFVAHRQRIERAVPLGDIEYVDGKNRTAMARGDSKLALVAIGRTDTHGIGTKDQKAQTDESQTRVGACSETPSTAATGNARSIGALVRSTVRRHSSEGGRSSRRIRRRGQEHDFAEGVYGSLEPVDHGHEALMLP
jgi:hypothetical protein